jgi:adenylate cyclase
VLAAWHHLGQPKMVLRVGEFGVEGLQIGERLVPTDEKGRLLINYRGDALTFPHVSIGDILAGEVPLGTFRDRVVLVGVTATGTYDMRSTPFNPVYPGVEIHANAIDNLITGDFISKPAWTAVYDAIAIAILAVLVALSLPRVSALAGLAITFSLFAVHIGVARELFVRWGVWLNIVYPLLSCVTTYTVLTVFYYVTEERERKKIRGAFDKYVSSDVIEQMMDDPSKLELGGEERIATVLFSDLQGFTSYSERFSPRQMMELLSEYYGCMTDAVFEHGGMLKEYVGDELMAIFGAPVEASDHAALACRAALAMQRKRRELSEEWLATGRPALHARTGVNSGPMLLGNIGSKHRFSYGAIGDDVNLGSRLEGLNKQYTSEILIGEKTRGLVGEAFLLREIDQVRVVGKKLPTRIFELLGEASDGLDSSGEKVLRTYTAALEAYRARRWSEALDLFNACRTHWPEDGPSIVMAVRCIEYADNPPDEDWDGVYEATRK